MLDVLVWPFRSLQAPDVQARIFQMYPERFANLAAVSDFVQKLPHHGLGYSDWNFSGLSIHIFDGLNAKTGD